MEDFNSKYTGQQVEDLLDQVASGNAGGGGGGITVETDPIFSASPAASITEQKIFEWNNLLSDFSILVSEDLVQLTNDVQGKQDALVSGDNIKTINGQSILGSGDITISGGSGEVGPQGPQGEQGPKGEDGEDGVGIASVKQTTTSTADGGNNVVTVTLSNGTTSTFTVKNGSKGSSGTNGTNGKDGATFTPSVDSAGNLSWTNNKGLANPPTVNIKGPKGDAGEGGGSSGGGKEVIVDNSEDVQINNALPNKIYILSSWEIYTIEITSFTEETAYDEYTFIFPYPLSGLSLPSDVVFANEVTPVVGADTLCELSIVGITIGSHRRYNAVLTTFGYL